MGLLGRLLGRQSSVSVTAEPLAAGALLSIVGESHYQPALEQTAIIAVRGRPPFPVTITQAVDEPDLPWFQAVLVREPDNQYDANAVAVFSPRGKVGYLGRDDAEQYQDVLLAVESHGSSGGACSAFMRRAENGNWGVVLAVSHPRICLQEMDQ